MLNCWCFTWPVGFKCLNALHIHHLGVSQFSPTTIVVSIVFRTVKYHYSTGLYTEGDKVTVHHVSNKVLHCADSRYVPHIQHYRWHTWHQSCSTSTYSYTLHIQCRGAVHSFTDTLSPTQIVHPTVEQKLFPHPVPQTHITVHSECYSKAHIHRWSPYSMLGYCVVTASQILISAMLLFTMELILMAFRWPSIICLSCIVTFGQLVWQTKLTDTHRQYCSVSSIMMGFMERKDF